MNEWDVPMNDAAEEPVAKTTRIGNPALCITVGIVVLAILVLLFEGYFKKRRLDVDLTHAMSCSRSIYCVMMDFESDMGTFPDDDSANWEDDLKTFRGDFSNNYLGQLIAGGYTHNEEIFSVFPRNQRRRADNVISPSSQILKAGENGLSYVMMKQDDKLVGFSTEHNGKIPFLLGPMSSKTGAFDPLVYGGRGFYLRIDGSVIDGELRKSDHKLPLDGGQRTLFDTGPGTVWGNDIKPIILLPK